MAVERAGLQKAGVIVHTGDLGYDFKPEFLIALTVTLAKWGIVLLFVDGNHEHHQWLNRQPLDPSTGLRQLTSHIWHIPRGLRWTWGGVTFLGLGGAHSVDGPQRRRDGDLWFPEETISPAQAAAAMEDGPADVLICHDWPAGVPVPGLNPGDFPFIETMRAEEHREQLRNIVTTVQPRWIWHGHLHHRHETLHDFGYGPVVVNGLGCNTGKLRDNLQFIDLDHLKLVKESPL